MKYTIEQVAVKFVQILAKNEFTEFERFAKSFPLAVPSRPPLSLPAWQRWQGHQTAAMSVNYCLPIVPWTNLQRDALHEPEH